MYESNHTYNNTYTPLPLTEYCQYPSTSTYIHTYLSPVHPPNFKLHNTVVLSLSSEPNTRFSSRIACDDMGGNVYSDY